MNIFYRINAVCFLALSLFVLPAFAGGQDELEQLEKDAIAHFASFVSAEDAYKEATAFKNGEKQGFALNSLTSIIYATTGYAQASQLSKNPEIVLKATHNLGMLYLARGYILTGRAMIEGAAGAGFQPSKRNSDKIKKAINQFGFDPIISVDRLPAELRLLDPYGRLDRDFEESIFETLAEQGVVRLKLTEKECALFGLNKLELGELETQAEDVEKRLLGMEDACVIMLGRSPLLLAMMLKARGILKVPVVNLPFSGMKSVDMRHASWEPLEYAYIRFMRQVLPKVSHYYVIDGFDSGATFRAIGQILSKWGLGPEKLHALPFDIVPPQKRRASPPPVFPHFGDWAFLPYAPNVVERATSKSLFARALIIPGIPFFPRQWIDIAYAHRVLTFVQTQDERPVVAHVRTQMEEYARMRGLVTRDLLANPLLNGDDATAIGEIMATEIVFGHSN